MTNHWAIIIGINHYQSLQSLMYAQRDASNLRQFLVKEVGLDSQHCVLLSEVSPAIEEAAVYPGREEIQTWINHICQEILNGEDLLWFFFSGYGVQFEGQDYLLPINSDPEHIPETALSIKSLFEIFKQAPTDNILVVLDINRSQSSLPGHKVGAQTIELAKDFGIPTLLSCQPDQFSQETFGVRHGLFTVALLEGMRYHGCVTLSHLAEYISDRLPELSEHHCRPHQTPVAVIPPEKKFLMVIPPGAVTRLPMTEAAAARCEVKPSELDLAESQAPPIPSRQGAVENPSDAALVSSFPSIQSLPLAEEPGLVEAQSSVSAGEQEGNLRNWGILAAIVLLLAVLYQNSPRLFPSQETSVPPTSPPSPPMTPENTAAIGEETPVDGENSSEVGSASEDSESVAAMRPTPENLTEGLSQVASSENLSGETATELSPLFTEPIEPVDSTTANSAIATARQAIAEQRYPDALILLEQAPIRERTEDYETLLSQAEAGMAQLEQLNRALLDEARGPIQPIQASQFNDAIAQASRIRPGEPVYEQAQRDIDRWSRVILDLAEGRAAAGNFAAALAAAELVPPDRPEVYRLAQLRIGQWRRQQANRQILQQARNSLRAGQASSFHDAIVMVRKIPTDQPEYPIAQQLANQWSQDILNIARARAAQGRFQDAILAADLVPQKTSAYEQAQAEIQRWR
ncbi:MAG: caspase family protein [Pseudanabaenales cyanobacterium]|nr:caspase family protein [Pseudanabaenales cyanobacterium]